MPVDPAAFRALHHGDHPLLLPNAWDHASAAALAAAGFAAVGTTSLGVAAANGLPDASGAARAETVALARLLGHLSCPVTVDVEAGFSDDPADVADLAAELAAAGAAGINIEDGRPGATLADPARQAELIRAVTERVPGLFVNARVDTYWLGAGDPAGTLARAEVYLAAGADGIFVPGLADEDVVAGLVADVAAPLNVLYQPGTHTVARLAELGVRRISTGSLLFRTALGAAVDAAVAIRDGEAPRGHAPTYAEVERLVGSPSGTSRDR